MMGAIALVYIGNVRDTSDLDGAETYPSCRDGVFCRTLVRVELESR